MNRTDRLLAIVLELQGKGYQHTEDLAKNLRERHSRHLLRYAGAALLSV